MAWRQFTKDAAKRIIAATKAVERQPWGDPKLADRAPPQAPWYYGKLKATLSPGGSAEMDVYKLSGGTWVDADFDITVYAPPVFTTGTIASAKWVQAMLHLQAGRYYVTAREC